MSRWTRGRIPSSIRRLHRRVPIRQAAGCLNETGDIVSLLVQRATGLLFGTAFLPAVILGPLSANAILIHDHHGHDLHTHGIAVHEVDDWSTNPEHGHEDHEHDGVPEEDPSADDSGPVVIVLELPDTLLRVRGLSAGHGVGTRLARLPLAVAIAPDPAAISCCPNAPWSGAHHPRSRTMVAGILLANHALLL